MKKGSFKFEKLLVWKKAMDFGEEVHLFSAKFPSDEKFNLTSQIRRATDSIALNISEGSIIQSPKEFGRFLGFSIRSLAEVITCLYKANNRLYLSKTEFEKHYYECFVLMNMLLAFRKKVLDQK